MNQYGVPENDVPVSQPLDTGATDADVTIALPDAEEPEAMQAQPSLFTNERGNLKVFAM